MFFGTWSTGGEGDHRQQAHRTGEESKSSSASESAETKEREQEEALDGLCALESLLPLCENGCVSSLRDILFTSKNKSNTITALHLSNFSVTLSYVLPTLSTFIQTIMKRHI